MTSQNAPTEGGIDPHAPVETPTGAPIRRRMGVHQAVPDTGAAVAETTVDTGASTVVPAARRRMGAGTASLTAQASNTELAKSGTGEEPLPTVTDANAVSAPRRRMGERSSAISATVPAATAAEGQPRMGPGIVLDVEPALTGLVTSSEAVSGTGSGATSANLRSIAVPTAPARSRIDTGNAAGRKRPAWKKPVAILVGVLVLAMVLVLGARWLRTLTSVQEFIATYNGHSTQPGSAPTGLPAWMGWQHFLNVFFIVLIIRTGLQIRTERKPPGYWSAKKSSFFSPKGNTPKKVSLTQWLHQILDVLWVLNGLVFVVLLVLTGHWMRIVPSNWDIVPNMLSAGIQYASLDWPTESGWLHYNALQLMAYFTIVFIASPLAIISGLRMSTWWPEKSVQLNKLYPVQWARAMHFPVMLYFTLFTITHVFLVFFTGALRNLNHMYTSRDVVDWLGLVIFLVSLVVIIAAWFLTAPLFTTPIAAKMGKVSKN